MKKTETLFSVLLIFAMLSVATLGSLSYFSDSETSQGNIFAAGSLDLKIDGKDNPDVANFALNNLKPGDATAGGGYGIIPGSLVWKAKNVGTLAGKLTIYVTNVVNYENGQTEPEAHADLTTGDLQGELGDYIRLQCFYNKAWCNEIGSITGIGSGKWEIVKDKPLNGGQEVELVINWWFNDPSLSGKSSEIVQTDSVVFDVVFRLEQA